MVYQKSWLVPGMAINLNVARLLNIEIPPEAG
jgi:hypothetical protein